MIAIIYCILITAVLFYVLFETSKERKRLIELLAAKDYADYKNFEDSTDETVLRRDKRNMFQKRNEAQQNKYIEME